MNDKELLELAAKAAGIVGEWVKWHDVINNGWKEGIDEGSQNLWNPLTDDGDALRLAVKLRLSIKLEDSTASAAGIAAYQLGAPTMDKLGPWYRKEWNSDSDPYAATRRAVVRAAAEIGRAM